MFKKSINGKDIIKNKKGEKMHSYKKSNGKIKKAALLISLIISVSVFSILMYRLYQGIEISDIEIKNNDVKVDRMSLKIDEEKGNNLLVVDMIENAQKTIVGISKIKNNGNSIFLEDSTRLLGIGTGVIIADNGYILTNWHVSGNKYSNCYVTMEDGRIFNGTVIWGDENIDLAIVKIPAKGLPHIALGDSDKVRAGEIVYAIGNPIGYEFQRTVTSGIVSAVNRTIKLEEDGKESYMEDLIQTDATINPGNSGGALINLDGEMIGISTIKITSAEGIGFAVPVNIVKPIIESFIKTGEFEEAYIGISGFDKNVIPYLSSGIEFNSGIYVAQINIDGPCYKTSLKEGDIITKIDGIAINTMSELKNYIYTKKPNDEVTITILRNKKESNIKILLGKK